MERCQAAAPQKSSSFSSARDEKRRESGRSLSLGSIKLEDLQHHEDADKKSFLEQVDEEEGAQEQLRQEETTGKKHGDRDDNDGHGTAAEEPHTDLLDVFEDIDEFLSIVSSLTDGKDEARQSSEIPQQAIGRFAALLEREIGKYESGEEKWAEEDEATRVLDAIRRASRLMPILVRFSSEHKLAGTVNVAGAVLHHAMSFLEDEFYSLLEDCKQKVDVVANPAQQTRRPPSFSSGIESDRCLLPPLPSAEPSNTEQKPPYGKEAVERLRRIAAEMIAGGYDAECVYVFSFSRSNALESSLSTAGYDKVSIDDVQRMTWESLEAAIASWTKAFRHVFSVTLPREQELCEAVFSDRPDVAGDVFESLTCGIVVHFLDFAEAVAMTKRSAEKLFKVLDMYETLRDAAKATETLFSGEVEEGDQEVASAPPLNIKSEVASAWSRLGEAAVTIFCELESSIKADGGKTPVPGGAVHPLTRYVMNYLKYACEYHTSLDQIFQTHKKTEKPSSMDEDGHDEGNAEANDGNARNSSSEHSPFTAQVMETMELLHMNLDAKAKLYKDMALSSVFLMNNGRYIMQKVKGSEEIHKLMGDTWCRRRSSELRQYHKNYQRETWGRVLGCLKDEGLQANGKVAKPVLKERFKSFNSMFEEIHKTQSTWVVSDKQLQSELRVSVSAVVVPAYRSFLGRFQQYFSPGRQTEKYVKFGPEDLETYIDELFDGTPASMVRRR